MSCTKVFAIIFFVCSLLALANGIPAPKPVEQSDLKTDESIGLGYYPGYYGHYQHGLYQGYYPYYGHGYGHYYGGYPYYNLGHSYWW